MTKYKDRIASGKIAIAVADTLPMQIDELKAGLATGNVGQRPFDMGYKVMYMLKDMKEGKALRPTRPTPASTTARRRPPTPASVAEAEFSPVRLLTATGAGRALALFWRAAACKAGNSEASIRRSA